MSAPFLLNDKLYQVFSELLPKSYMPNAPENFLLGVIDDETGCACGVLWYRFYHMRYEIMYLGVHPAFRRRGYGTRLLDAFLSSVHDSGLFAPVYVSFEDRDEFIPFRLFMSSRGDFFETEDTTIFVVDPVTFGQSSMIKKLAEKNGRCSLFSQLSPGMQDAFFAKAETGIKLKDTFRSGQAHLIQELCLCHKDEDSVKAAIFFEKRPDGNLELSFLYNNENSGASLAEVLSATVRVLMEKYEERTIYFEAVNDDSYLLACKLFPDPSIRVINFHRIWDFSL